MDDLRMNTMKEKLRCVQSMFGFLSFILISFAIFFILHRYHCFIVAQDLFEEQWLQQTEMCGIEFHTMMASS